TGSPALPSVIGMDITVHHTMVPHDDPEAALAFYRDTLGLEVLADVGYAGMRWITLGPADGSGTSIVLYPLGADPGVTPEEQRVIKEMMAKGTFASLFLSTTDVDAAFEVIAARDAEVVQEPTDQDYGVRDCAFRDPAGTLVRLQQVRR